MLVGLKGLKNPRSSPTFGSKPVLLLLYLDKNKNKSKLGNVMKLFMENFSNF